MPIHLLLQVNFIDSNIIISFDIIIHPTKPRGHYLGNKWFESSHDIVYFQFLSRKKSNNENSGLV